MLTKSVKDYISKQAGNYFGDDLKEKPRQEQEQEQKREQESKQEEEESKKNETAILPEIKIVNKREIIIPVPKSTAKKSSSGLVFLVVALLTTAISLSYFETKGFLNQSISEDYSPDINNTKNSNKRLTYSKEDNTVILQYTDSTGNKKKTVYENAFSDDSQKKYEQLKELYPNLSELRDNGLIAAMLLMDKGITYSQARRHNDETDQFQSSYDCSSFVNEWCYLATGKNLKDRNNQALTGSIILHGEKIKYEDMLPGDVFLYNSDYSGDNTHALIYIGNGEVEHCSSTPKPDGEVKITKVSYIPQLHTSQTLRLRLDAMTNNWEITLYNGTNIALEYKEGTDIALE